jgi:hypothetical protein
MQINFYFKPLDRKDHLEELTVYAKIIKMDIRKMVYDHVDWTHLAQNRDQWRFLVNTVMNCGDFSSISNTFSIVNI